MIKKLFLPAFAAFTVSCNHAQKDESKAHIIERKLLSNGKLMIYYVFELDNKLVNDSSVVENKVLPHDSITIEIASENPMLSRIDLSNSP